MLANFAFLDEEWDDMIRWYDKMIWWDDMIRWYDEMIWWDDMID